MTHASNPNTQAWGSEAEGHLQLHSKSEASLGHETLSTYIHENQDLEEVQYTKLSFTPACKLFVCPDILETVEKIQGCYSNLEEEQQQREHMKCLIWGQKPPWDIAITVRWSKICRSSAVEWFFGLFSCWFVVMNALHFNCLMISCPMHCVQFSMQTTLQADIHKNRTCQAQRSMPLIPAGLWFTM